MKKLILLAFVALVTKSYAQIPNGDFESWTDMGTYVDPDNWATLNQATDPLGVYTCTQGSPGVTGSFYLKITSKPLGGVGIVPGIAVCGAIDLATYTPTSGFPCSTRPEKLTGSWQYMASGTDQGYIAGSLTKWNTGTGKRDTIAVIYYALPGMEMAWADFSIDWLYMSAETPDSALIILSASGFMPANNSYLWVDNLAFDGDVPTGIQNMQQTAFTVFPNPASDVINISDVTGIAQHVEEIYISDIAGNIVYDAEKFENNIDVNYLPSGEYILTIISSQLASHYPFAKK